MSLLVTPEKHKLWQSASGMKEYAEAYNRELYPQIEKIVASSLRASRQLRSSRRNTPRSPQIAFGAQSEELLRGGGQLRPLLFCSNLECPLKTKTAKLIRH
jgi:hypothetical protein